METQRLDLSTNATPVVGVGVWPGQARNPTKTECPFCDLKHYTK
jgi:hypothetical protein